MGNTSFVAVIKPAKRKKLTCPCLNPFLTLRTSYMTSHEKWRPVCLFDVTHDILIQFRRFGPSCLEQTTPNENLWLAKLFVETVL